jgi:DNA-binding transcriptional ArsR family regulator
MPRSAALSATYGALADDTRRGILELLAGGPQRAGRIADNFPHLTRAAVSRHLAVLEDAALVRVQTSGCVREYSIRGPQFAAAAAYVERYRRFWSSGLDRLAELAED